MKIGRLFALQKSFFEALEGFLVMMDDIKKAVTQMFCVKMAFDSIFSHTSST